MERNRRGRRAENCGGLVLVGQSCQFPDHSKPTSPPLTSECQAIGVADQWTYQKRIPKYLVVWFKRQCSVIHLTVWHAAPGELSPRWKPVPDEGGKWRKTIEDVQLADELRTIGDVFGKARGGGSHQSDIASAKSERHVDRVAEARSYRKRIPKHLIVWFGRERDVIRLTVDHAAPGELPPGWTPVPNEGGKWRKTIKEVQLADELYTIGLVFGKAWRGQLG